MSGLNIGFGMLKKNHFDYSDFSHYRIIMMCQVANYNSVKPYLRDLSDVMCSRWLSAAQDAQAIPR